MFLNEFNQTSIGRVASLNKMLSDEFGIKINPGTKYLELPIHPKLIIT